MQLQQSQPACRKLWRLVQVEARGSGLCTPPLTNHWVWPPLEGREHWVGRSFIRGWFLGGNSAARLHQPILPAAGKWKPHSKREYLGGAPHRPLQRDSKEKQAHPHHRAPERLRTDDAAVSEGKRETWGWKQWHRLKVYLRGPHLSSTMMEDWRFTMRGNLTRQVPELEALNVAGVSWEAPENGRGEDSFLKMGKSTFWVVSSPAPYFTQLTRPQWSHREKRQALDKEFISRETGQPKRNDLPQWDFGSSQEKKQASHLITLMKITKH